MSSFVVHGKMNVEAVKVLLITERMRVEPKHVNAAERYEIVGASLVAYAKNM